MEIRSLGFRTSLMFARFAGMVVDKGSYTLIQTPSNPGYYWGNFIIFDRAPSKGDLLKWKQLFDKEFGYLSRNLITTLLSGSRAIPQSIKNSWMRVSNFHPLLY